MEKDDNNEKKPTPFWGKLVVGGCVVFGLWFSFISRPFWDWYREFALSREDVQTWTVSIGAFLFSWWGWAIGLFGGICVHLFLKTRDKRPPDNNNEE